jgi:hypothetical protein
MGSCPFYKTTGGSTMTTKLTQLEAFRTVEIMKKSIRDVLLFAIVALGLLVIDIVQDNFFWYLSSPSTHLPIALFCSMVALVGFLWSTRKIVDRKAVSLVAIAVIFVAFLSIYGMLALMSVGWFAIHGGAHVGTETVL